MLSTRTPVVALVGNPNTGKTTLFNALAGMNQRTGNYPGVTVETKKGKLRHDGLLLEIVDLPGTYSLAPRSPDEMVAVDLLLGHKPGGDPRPDAVVVIVDASNLERNLYLMTQVLELGIPVVLALNMMDVARAQGVSLDVPALERNLGVPVVPLQANRGQGLDRLKDAVVQAVGRPFTVAGPSFPAPFEDEIRRLHQDLGNGTEAFLLRRLLLDVGGHTERVLAERHGESLLASVRQARGRLAEAGCAVPGIEARTRYAWIRSTAGPCIDRPAERVVTWTDRLDRVLTHRVWGTVIFLAVMFLVFQSIFQWAGPLMDLIGVPVEVLGDWIGGALKPGPLRGLLVDGIVGGVGGVLVFLPQIMILFLFIALLEDCGYMARAAFLMDRLMSRAGLNGKSFIPLLSSVACAVPGIMAARVIENRRDRLATILVAPLMSCSARLPVYLLLTAAFLGPQRGYSPWVPGMVIFSMYAIGLIAAPLVAFALKRTLLKGETPAFVMEMPLYKAPSPWLVLRRSLEAGWMFVRRAGTIILASMIVVWALLYFPATDPDTGLSYDIVLADLEAERDERLDRDGKEKAAADIRSEIAGLGAGDEARRRSLTAALKVLESDLAAWDDHADFVRAEYDPRIRDLRREWKAQTLMGLMGHAIEPAVRPLGWDWRIGMAALASFPAREVMVGSLGIIFGEDEGDAGDEDYQAQVGAALARAQWQDGSGRLLFTTPVALSLLVFFALCCQCASTLAIIKRETNSWRWPIFTFVYMTALAYLGALVVYQVGTALGA